METKWLNDVKKGKYTGIQQAGLLYSYGFQYKEYVELTIHELMEKLNDNDEIIRRNAYWMISKISNRSNHRKFLIPVIPILKFGIMKENKRIREYSLQAVHNLAKTMPKKVTYLYNEILEGFDSFEKDNQILSLNIFIELSEYGKLIPSNDFFIKYIGDKKLSPYLVKLLIYQDSYKSIFSLVLSNLQKHDLSKVIFAFIDEACNKRPLKILLALKKTLLKMDPMIRQNSLLILSQNPSIRNNPKIYLILPEILKLITSKIQAINRISLFLLYDIHKIIIKELFFYSENLLKLRKMGDNTIKIVIDSILIDMASIDIDIIQKYKKRIYKNVKKAKNSKDVRLATIATLGYSKIILWIDYDNKNIGSHEKAIDSCLTLIKKYPISDYRYYIYERIGFLNLYNGNFSEAKKFFKEAVNTKQNLLTTYRSTVFLILVNFILHLPKTALEIEAEFKKECEDFTLFKSMKKEIQIWFDVFEDLYHFKIKNAKNKLKSYYGKIIIKNKWEFQNKFLILQHLNEIKDF
ncbi:MAG: hypothetical protein EU549_00605 [Promethearchaeota archaeon]|nr:MAG: hypothetical protein EU549_00605 [Candidatus Lokiarchaeota archaeon]